MGVYSHDFGNLQLGFMGGIEHGQWVILVFFPYGARSPGCPPVSITRFAGKSTMEFGDESHPRKR